MTGMQRAPAELGGCRHHSTVRSTENEKTQRGAEEKKGVLKEDDPQRGGRWHLFFTRQKREDEEQEEDQDAAASLLSWGQDAALIAAIRESDKARAGSAAIRPKQKPGEAHLHH